MLQMFIGKNTVNVSAFTDSSFFRAVFTWNHLVVIAAECTGSESDALDLVPAITSAVLEEHHLIVGVVVVVDPGSIRHGPGGEKLRSTIRSLFLEEKLNPIYVAYHM